MDKIRLKTISESLSNKKRVNESGDGAYVPTQYFNDSGFWKIGSEKDYLEWWAKEMGQSVEELVKSEPDQPEVAKLVVNLIQNSKLISTTDTMENMGVPVAKLDGKDYLYIVNDKESERYYIIASDLPDGDFWKTIGVAE